MMTKNKVAFCENYFKAKDRMRVRFKMLNLKNKIYLVGI